MNPTLLRLQQRFKHGRLVIWRERFSMGVITDDLDKDTLKGQQGVDELFGGSGDKLKP